MKDVYRIEVELPERSRIWVGIFTLVMGTLCTWQAGTGQILLPGSSPTPRLALPLGVLAIFAGVVLLLWREGRVIDGRRHTVTSWWGLLVPLYRVTAPLELYTWVIVRLPQPGGSAPQMDQTRVPVMLEGNQRVVRLGEFFDQTEALRLADRVATVTGLEVRTSDVRAGHHPAAAGHTTPADAMREHRIFDEHAPRRTTQDMLAEAAATSTSDQSA